MTQGFSYHPAETDVRPHLATGRISRLIALDTGVRDVVDSVGEARWLGDAEAQLPAGIYTFLDIDEPLLLYVPFGLPPTDGASVALADLTDDHALAEAWRWAEHWWELAAPVPAPRFPVNSPALQKSSGVEFVPTERRFSHGHWSYRVTVDGRTRWEPEAGLTEAAFDNDPETWVKQEPADVARFAATLTRAKLSGRFADTLFSFRATRTLFRPYQFKPVMKLLQTGKDRLLIADEVGLGKTIEAGLVWTELEARGQADRVLIVCPSSLLGKWEQEMQERFNLELEELDMPRLRKFKERHRENRLPKRFRYITSLERLRRWEGLEELADDPPDLDLVIVDEAHSMRNTGTKSNQAGSMLQGWSDAMIFLTATPINLRQRDLYNLLDLLVPEDLGDYEDLIERLQPNAVLNEVGRLLASPGATARDRLAPLGELGLTRYGSYVAGRPDFARLKAVLGQQALVPADVVEARRLIADLNTLSTVITRTKKSEVDEDKALREALWQPVEWTDVESRFYNEFVEWCRNRAEAANTPVYFSQQMPLRLASACLPMAKRAVVDWVPGLLQTDEVDDEDAIYDDLSPSRLVPPHVELLEAAEALDSGIDSKFDALVPVIDRMVAEGRQTLLFTFSRPTLAYLQNRLRQRFRIAVLHGGVNREGRRSVMADFRAGHYDLVLASKVASEGLDFEFCSAIINYDLPWNPMEIEQRIGRIDRIGQTSEKILVASFRNDETIDERIIARVLERIQIFEDSIGALEPIVNSQMKVLKEAFDFTLTPEQKERKLEQFLAAVEENKAGLKDVADATTGLVVGNDVDVSGLEDELEKSGRYVGQIELAHLIADWAATDNAPGVTISDDASTVSIRGNAEMARRVEGLAAGGRRSRPEVDPYAAGLRSGVEMHFALDQELARSGKYDLLTATSPLVMAAASVPGHRQVRYSHATAPRHDDSVPTGIYLVVLAHAVFHPRDESELWATAVTPRGAIDDGPVANALLAALARGTLSKPLRPIADGLALPQLTARAMDSLHDRHARETDAIQRDQVAMAQLRRTTYGEQHRRRMQSIQGRIDTGRERGVTAGQMKGFEGMRRKAESRYEELVLRLETEPTPTIGLEPIAVCVLEVTE